MLVVEEVVEVDSTIVEHTVVVVAAAGGDVAVGAVIAMLIENKRRYVNSSDRNDTKTDVAAAVAADAANKRWQDNWLKAVDDVAATRL